MSDVFFRWAAIVGIILILVVLILTNIKDEERQYTYLQADSLINAKIDSIQDGLIEVQAGIMFNDLQREQNSREVEESKKKISFNNKKLKDREKDILQNPVDSSRIDNVKRYLQQRIKSRKDLP